jgi:hexulose-6-phosphate isomerase
MIGKVGFMQGRLSEVVDGKIQAFPWNFWQEEFKVAGKKNIPLMEWTLDQYDLYMNPLMTVDGQRKIIRLSDKYDLKIPSLTGDCFMQAPFWKASVDKRKSLLDDFNAIVAACSSLNIKIIVIPLVDGGALTSRKEENYLVDILSDHESFLVSNQVRIAFESDFSPVLLERFIEKFNPSNFGINYDIGNSASLGFNVNEEFSCYGDRILNVHVKDRPLGGATVPLGDGNANFDAVFSNLSKYDYTGNYILQTARDASGQHTKVIMNYLDKTANWISDNES